jgi:NitT/TauT family transport system ATP-binding protein
MAGNNNQLAVAVRELSKTYVSRKGSLEALRAATFDVPDGAFISLVGPSGCGKSTLLKIVGGLIPKTSGTVHVHDTEVTGPLRQVGIMFQTPVLFPWRTILQNLLLPAEVYGLGMKDARGRCEELLGITGLAEFRDAYPRELSGGMQQRAALCRVLAYEPEVLLLDEPFGALDEFTRERMNLEVLRLWHINEPAIIFVTHNIGEAVFLSDYVCVMTPCPGCVAEIIKIDLPRPREMTVMKAPEYSNYVFQIREILGV